MGAGRPGGPFGTDAIRMGEHVLVLDLVRGRLGGATRWPEAGRPRLADCFRERFQVQFRRLARTASGSLQAWGAAHPRGVGNRCPPFNFVRREGVGLSRDARAFVYFLALAVLS